MRLTIKATGIEHTNALDAYVSKRLAELEKYLDPKERSCIARVEISKETKHHKTGLDVFKAELTMRAGKRDFRIVKTDEADLYAAIDAMRAEVIMDVKDHYSRLRDLRKDGARDAKKILKSL